MPTVTGRVTGPDGGPVAGAVIFVVAAPVPLPDIARLTGTDGSFDVDVPARGTYVIGANGPDGGRSDVEVEVGSSDPPPIEIALPA
ncbi:carboxypeptidase-like regulatory domain-containing protein [Allosphingosinicella sp.]|jgi:hypothetical protein|uniref:carboxypeptidase-like regulatory domain-containing protein n=1 Tax=Allosphingosinicella sp. TaxID=2823234 RepID=UPI002F098B41